MERRQEPEAVELEINVRLFPAWLLQMAAEQLHRHIELAVGHLPGADDALLVVKARSSSPIEEILPLFRAALTSLLLENRSQLDRNVQAESPSEEGLTLQVVSQGRAIRAVVRLTDWARLVDCLAQLQMSLPVIETLAPVDRVVVCLALKPAVAPEDAMGEFLRSFNGGGPVH